MSRSTKHTPISAITTAKSEKFDKRQWNSSYRAAANKSDDPPSQKKQNNRNGAKDGKLYWKKDTPYLSLAEMMRK